MDAESTQLALVTMKEASVEIPEPKTKAVSWLTDKEDNFPAEPLSFTEPFGLFIKLV
jgi:hypothetical protein